MRKLRRITAYILAGIMTVVAIPQNGTLIFAGSEEYDIQEMIDTDSTASIAPASVEENTIELVPDNTAESAAENTTESVPNGLAADSVPTEEVGGETAASLEMPEEIVLSEPGTPREILVEEAEEAEEVEENDSGKEELESEPESTEISQTEQEITNPENSIILNAEEIAKPASLTYSNENEQDVIDGLIPYLSVEAEPFGWTFEEGLSVKAEYINNEDTDRYMQTINEDFGYPKEKTPAENEDAEKQQADSQSDNTEKITGAKEDVVIESALSVEIGLVDENGQPYMTSDKLTVKIRTEKPEQYVSCQLYHIKHDDTIEKLNFIIYDPEEELDPYIQFNTDGLSPFIFVNEKTETVSEIINAEEAGENKTDADEEIESVITAAPDEEKTDKEDEAEEEEKDKEQDLISIYAGNPSAADIVTGPDDLTAATTTVTQQAAAKGKRRGLKSNASGVDWTFDDYYIEKQAVVGNHLTKTDNFYVKYQMDIHFSRDVAQGKCIIRIPQTLFTDKKGEAYKPKSIPVPMGTPGNYTESVATPFNYYEDGDDLVFWNFRSIVSGTNASVQVLYPTEDILEVPDGTEWSITPEISVEYPETTETGTGIPLTGEINTQVRLKTLVKEATDYADISYTPGLYTLNQVERFVSIMTTPQPFNDYVYALWRIEATGTGNQEYEVYMKDAPRIKDGARGIIVGFSDNFERMTSGPYAGYYKIAHAKARTFDSRVINGKMLLVVTAYPKSSVTPGSTVLQNDVEMILHPADGLDEDSIMTDSAEWVYQDYEWIYAGDTIGIHKYNNFINDSVDKDHDYKGWMSVYKAMREKGLDSEGPTFRTTGILRSFNLTHYTDRSGSGNFSIGDYRPGAYVKTTTVDDIMIAYPIDGAHAGESLRLTDEDYFFNSAKIVVSETGYDVYEDEETYPTETHAQIDRTCRFYAMFAGSNEWELVGSVPYSADGKYIYELTDAQIARAPYKIKTEFNSTEYYLTQKIYVGMTIRHDSPIFGQLLDSETIRVENISGIYGWYASNTEPGRYIQDTDIHDSNYSEQDVLELTRDWYGTILMRDAAFGTLRAVKPHAAASKSVIERSDVRVGRIKLLYTAKAFESYDVYSQNAVYAMKKAGVRSPDRQEVEFYDLLPPHVHFDPSVPVTAGLLNRADLSNSITPSTAWLKRNVTVTVNPETDIIDNWNNTGRMMVVFHVSSSTGETSYFDDNASAWFTGYGIEFGAYVDWEDLKTMYDEPNIVAYMPVSSDTRPLLGTDLEVSMDDGNPVTSMYNEDNYLVFGSDINGDGVTNIRNVLFADSLELENFPIATESGIVKKVRADKDLFAMYGNSAAVSCNEGYTYQINVQNSSRYDIKDIVIFDRLENAAIDRRVEEPGMNFEADGWHGTFRDITTSDLDRNDIAYVIYYNTNRNAVIPATDGDPYAVLSGNGWVRADAYTGNVADVKAIAVDISKKTNGDDFLIHNGESIGFNIRMRAPGTLQTYEWAYNNPSFYSTTMGDTNVSQTVIGNSVKVKLKNAKNLIVEKKYKGTVPADVLDTEYEFWMVRRSTGAKLTDQIYELFEKNASTGVYEPVEDEGTLSTDANGHLYLRPNQKAIFYGISDAEDIKADETSLPNWQATTTETTTTDAHNILVENEYRPIVYMKKITASVPDDVNVSSQTFSFQVKENGTPAANRTLWVVSTIPKGNNPPAILGTRETDANGIVTLRADETLCMQLGAIGNTWSVEELSTNYGEGTDWLCEEPLKTGTASTTPGSAVIQNIYRYKKLNLSKSVLNNQTSSSFTFKIWKVNDGATPSGNDPSLYATPAAGLSWKTTDNKYPSYSGTTNANGELSTYLTGRTATVSGLIGNCTYIIQEILSNDDYKSDKDLYIIKTPLFGTTAYVQITNIYQKSSLKINKTVQSATAVPSNKTFNIKVEVKLSGTDTWVPAANKQVYVYTATGSNTAKTTDENGVIAIPAGGTAMFRYTSDIGRIGDKYRISEEPDPDYPSLYPLEGEYIEGVFNIGDNECEIINGSKDALYINKRYIAGDNNSDSISIANNINNYKTSSVAVSDTYNYWTSYQSFSAYAYLEVNEGSGWRRITPADTNYEFYLISGNNTQRLSASAYNQNGAFLVPVGGVIAVQIAGGSVRDIQYRITETGIKESYINKNTRAIGDNIAGSEDDPGEISWIVQNNTYGSYWVNPEESSIVIEQDGSVNNRATLQNTVCKQPTKKITKQVENEYGVTYNNVPEGSVVAFRFEKYDGSKWTPAEGIRYYTNENPNLRLFDKLQYTGPDGMVYVKKIKNEIPTINVAKEIYTYTEAKNAKVGDVRIVEVPEKTDEAFGNYLGNSCSDTSGTIKNIYGGTTFEVSKATSEKTDAIFTFKLSGKAKGSNQAYSVERTYGIPYVVYDASTNEIISTGETSENGTFELMGGQYARLTVPPGIWTVTETEPHPWVLDSVDINDEIRETKDANFASLNAYPAYISSSTYMSELAQYGGSNYQYTTHIYTGAKAEYADKIAGIDGITMDYNKTGLIKGYFVPNGDDTYSLYILAEDNGKVKVGDSGVSFAPFGSLKYADIHGLDTSSTNTLSGAFSSCRNLETVDGMQDLDYSSMTNMGNMFAGCSALKEVDIHGTYAPNLQNITYMFGGCTNLKELDMHETYWPMLQSEDSFLAGCVNMEKLDMSNSILKTDTSDDSWGSMFPVLGTNTENGCEIDLHNSTLPGHNLIYISSSSSGAKISKLDLTDVKLKKDAEQLLYNCTINEIVGFNTMDVSDVTNAGQMIYNVSGLEELDLSGMNFANVSDLDIYKLPDLKTINLSNTKIGRPGKYMSGYNYNFSDCNKLEYIIAKNFFSAESNPAYRFKSPNLKKVDFSGAQFPHLEHSYVDFDWRGPTKDTLELVDFSNVTAGNLRQMFQNCNAKEINVTGLKCKYTKPDDSSYISEKSAENMFAYVQADKITGLSTMDLSEVKNAVAMFGGSNIVQGIDMQNMNMENCTGATNMFAGLGADTKKLNISGLYAPKICDTYNLTGFISGSALEEIDMSNCAFETDKEKTKNYYNSIISNSPKLIKIDMSNTKFGDSTNNGSSFDSFIWLSETNPDVSLPLTIDLTGFQFGRKANLNLFFRGCTRLKTIYCSDDWNAMTDYPDASNPNINTSVFDINADSLLTGAVPYSTSNKGVDYANPSTGYFTRKSA